MSDATQLILDDEQGITPPTRRRYMLPTWIKVFAWIFILAGSLMVIAIPVGLFGIPFQLALYGFETYNPLTLIGISIMLLFATKGIVGYGLWTEKDWAVKLAIVDAILGTALCTFVMPVLPFISEEPGFRLNLRLELVTLIPYFLKMRKIKEAWEKYNT